MKSYLLPLIIIILSFNISFQKTSELDLSNILFPKQEEKSQNYSNLKEWLSQLMIEIPNDLINNITQGLVEDLTIYGVNLDKIITTNPELIDNKIGVNMSVTNAGFTIRGVFTLFSLNKVFIAHVSNLNAQLPFYLVKDPESGLVTEVDTNGLNIDFENIDIELELNIGDLLGEIVINVLREVLLALKPQVIEPSLIELLNTKIGGLFQKMNDIIINGAEPKKLNITIREKDLSDLKKSPIISAVAYLLNNLTGADGPLSLNSLVNIITSDSGIVRLHEFYNKSINFEFNLTDQKNGSLGNFEIGLEDLNISGLNTWKNFTALEPYNKILLYSYTYLQNLTINISLSIKVKLDNSSNVSANNTILYEKLLLSTNLKDNSLKANLQMPIDNKKANEYSDKDCLNFNCLLGLADSNGTGITSLSLNESFSYILLDLDRQGELEDDLDDAIDKLIDLFVSSFDDKIGLFINALLNKTGIDFINKQINNYLYSNYCPRKADIQESELNKLITSIAFLSAFTLFILIILGPYIIGKACLKEKNEINENLINEENNRLTNVSELKNGKNIVIHPKYCFPGITIQWIKELGRIDPIGASLFLHPDISIFWRIFIPLAILSTVALFISSNSGTGASVFLVFEVGRRIQIPSLFDFGLINSVRDMWKAGVYFLAVIVALFSGFWPYVKLVLMLISFILPASLFNKKKRGKILMILDALGKWSILDSYVLILMLVAFHFHIEFPVVKPSEAKEGSIADVFVYAAYGFVTLILGTIISLFLSHIITHLNRSLEEHPDQNKGEKAESYKTMLENVIMHMNGEVKLLEPRGGRARQVFPLSSLTTRGIKPL